MKKISFTHGSKLLAACLAAVALLAASCGDSASGLQQSYQNAYGDAHSTAALTPGPIGTSTRISVTARVACTQTSSSVDYFCTGTTLVQGSLFFTDGTSVSKALSGTSGKVTANKGNLWYCRAKLGSGDYWYFDRSGDYWYFDRTGTWHPSTTTRTTSDFKEKKGTDVVVSTAILTDSGDTVVVTFGDDDQVTASSTLGLDTFVAGWRGRHHAYGLEGSNGSVDTGSARNPDGYVLFTSDGSGWVFDEDGLNVPDAKADRDHYHDD